jgi:hypothetical protein
MLWAIFVILLILWVLGMSSSYTIGGFSRAARPRAGSAVD